jgi:hypothetical protein
MFLHGKKDKKVDVVTIFWCTLKNLDPYGLQATYIPTPFTYQSLCNLLINYLTFLLTYITNDLK